MSIAPRPTTASATGSSRVMAHRFPTPEARSVRDRRCTFPTETVAVSTLLPDFDQYAGPPIEFGRMEPTASDPDVQQQYGMTVGTPNSGQINALGTLNLRGERSVTCKGDRDRHPSHGPLAGRIARRLRGVPQAAGCPRARGRARCTVRRAARSREAADVLHSILVQGSIRHDGHAHDSGGRCAVRHRLPRPRPHARRPAAPEGRDHLCQGRKHGIQRNPGAAPAAGTSRKRSSSRTSATSAAVGAGNPHSAYDATRAASLGSSSGSGASVSANLVMCSICEETSMSCRGPANHNSVALILPHKSMVSFLGGAIGADIHNDRSGIHCRSVTDSAKVLDALKDPVNGYYDPRDLFTTVPRASVLDRRLCRGGNHAWRARVTQGHAHRDHPRVDAHLPWHQGGRADRHRGRKGNQGGSRGTSGRHPGGIHRSALARRSGRSRTCRRAIHAHSPNSCRSSSRSCFIGSTGRDSRSSRNSPPPYSPPNLHPAARSDRER